MKKIRRAGVFAALMLMLVLVPSVTASAGFRRVAVREDGRTKLYYRYYTSKTEYIRGRDIRGGRYAYLRWTFKNLRSNGTVYTYCFDENGYMLTGWHKLTTKASDGEWHWYYFDDNGRMYKNRTKNGHYLQANGQMLENGYDGETYYGEDGSRVDGYDPEAEQGLEESDGGTKYMQADGTYAEKKWVCMKDESGKYGWYYFYSNGMMAKDTWVGSRYVDENGRLQ